MIAAYLLAPFAILIAPLALAWAGLIALDERIEDVPFQILDLVLYWLALAGAAWAGLNRRAILAVIRRRRAQLLLMAVSAFFAAAVVELLLRLIIPGFGIPPHRYFASPSLVHRYPPNARMYAGSTAYFYDGTAMTVRTNQDGLRTQYSREEFLDHASRIAVLGDSYTFGLGVQADRTFSSVMEETLRERLRTDDLAVLNAGIPSYSPLIEKILFRKVVRHYQPQVTLLFLDMTDIGDDHLYARHILSEQDGEIVFDVPDEKAAFGLADRIGLVAPLREIARRFLLPLKTLGLLFSSETDPASDDMDSFFVGGVTESNRYFILKHPLDETMPFFRETLGHVQELANEVRRSGSEFILVIMPRYFHWNTAECPENWEFPKYGTEEPYKLEFLRFFDSVADEVDFPIFQLLPAFESAGDSPLVFTRDPHWNATGHLVAGKATVDFLLARKLVH